MSEQSQFHMRLPAVNRPRRLLHVGCNIKQPGKLPTFFEDQQWQEIRLDIDPGVEPDIVASVTDMKEVSDESMDAVYAAHILEHLFSFEVILALKECFRVLIPGGFLQIVVPDFEKAANLAIKRGLYKVAYQSNAGPIRPIDMIFGFGPAIHKGNRYMAHHCGFTGASLKMLQRRMGFINVQIVKKTFDIWSVAYRPDQKK